MTTEIQHPTSTGPAWRDTLDRRLIRRLLQRTFQPGIIDRRLGQTILDRMQALFDGLPLLRDLARRWNIAEDARAGKHPIVYAQRHEPVRDEVASATARGEPVSGRAVVQASLSATGPAATRPQPPHAPAPERPVVRAAPKLPLHTNAPPGTAPRATPSAVTNDQPGETSHRRMELESLPLSVAGAPAQNGSAMPLAAALAPELPAATAQRADSSPRAAASGDATTPLLLVQGQPVPLVQARPVPLVRGEAPVSELPLVREIAQRQTGNAALSQPLAARSFASLDSPAPRTRPPESDMPLHSVWKPPTTLPAEPGVVALNQPVPTNGSTAAGMAPQPDPGLFAAPTSGATPATPAPITVSDDLVEQVLRRLRRRLMIEGERRGGRPWP